jgi:hypothetical protein
MRGFHNSSFDPPTLVVLEAAFDEAWLTLKSNGNTTVKPDELARSVLRLAKQGLDAIKWEALRRKNTRAISRSTSVAIRKSLIIKTYELNY